MMKSENKRGNLIDFACNNFSQNGEDGIIQEIVKRIGLQKIFKKRVCRIWCLGWYSSKQYIQSCPTRMECSLY